MQVLKQRKRKRKREKILCSGKSFKMHADSKKEKNRNEINDVK